MVGMRTRLAIERAGTVTPHLKRGAPVLYPNRGVNNRFLSLHRAAPGIRRSRGLPWKSVGRAWPLSGSSETLSKVRWRLCWPWHTVFQWLGTLGSVVA
jgi:hypothetical protein